MSRDSNEIRETNIRPGHFRRVFLAHTGMTPMAMVRKLRMAHAAFLLDTTTASLEAIAARVGYTSPYSFSQAFTRFHGVRPGRYRSGARGNSDGRPME